MRKRTFVHIKTAYLLTPIHLGVGLFFCITIKYIAYLDNVIEFNESHQRESYTIVTLNVDIGLKYFCRKTEILIRHAVFCF